MPCYQTLVLCIVRAHEINQTGRDLKSPYHNLLLTSGAVRSDQVAQGLIWLGSENLQGWCPHSPLGQPVLLFHSTHSGKILLGFSNLCDCFVLLCLILPLLFVT